MKRYIFNQEYFDEGDEEKIGFNVTKAIEIQNTVYDSAAEKASDAPETAKKTTERTSSPVRRTTPLKTTSTSTKKD